MILIILSILNNRIHWRQNIPRLVQTLQELEDRSKSDPEIKVSLDRLKNSTKGPHRFTGRKFSEVFYIPKERASIYSKVAKIFASNNVYHGIAVPTILAMIEPRETHIKLNAFAEWDNAEHNYPRHISKLLSEHPFCIHPIKWNIMQHNHQIRDIYCKLALPWIYKVLPGDKKVISDLPFVAYLFLYI